MSLTNHDLLDAQRILAGESMMLPTIAHLRALHEHHEIQLLRIANQLDTLREYVLNLD